MSLKYIKCCNKFIFGIIKLVKINIVVQWLIIKLKIIVVTVYCMVHSMVKNLDLWGTCLNLIYSSNNILWPLADISNCSVGNWCMWLFNQLLFRFWLTQPIPRLDVRWEQHHWVHMRTASRQDMIARKPKRHYAATVTCSHHPFILVGSFFRVH